MALVSYSRTCSNHYVLCWNKISTLCIVNCCSSNTYKVWGRTGCSFTCSTRRRSPAPAPGSLPSRWPSSCSSAVALRTFRHLGQRYLSGSVLPSKWRFLMNRNKSNRTLRRLIRESSVAKIKAGANYSARIRPCINLLPSSKSLLYQ